MKAVSKPLRLALATVVALALAAPAAAYVIMLADGSKIIAAHEYEVQGDQAIITMPNGTRTSIDLAEIDREATEKANRQGYGDAVIVDDGTTRQVKEVDEAEIRQRRLSDLANRETNLDRLEPRRRAEPQGVRSAGTTTAGFPNLSGLVRQPFADLEVASQVQRSFRGQGIDGVELYQGTGTGHLLAEVTAGSEASVFRSLEVAAEALLAAHESYPQRIVALELILMTPDQARAGQFVLDSELARELVSGGTEVSRFFVQHVQF
jgi:hypothetical protein